MATGGGGYQWARVVPRAWTIYFAEMCEADLPEHLPESWIEQVELAIGGEVPATFTEPPLPHGRPDTETRGVIHLVRQSVFPALGLEP